MAKWEFDMDTPVSWIISANGREHWAQRGRKTKSLRASALMNARRVQLPKNLERVRVLMRFDKPPGTIVYRDIMNMAPSVKAIMDGLVDYGLVADDDDSHVEGPFPQPGYRLKSGYNVRIHVSIEQLPPLAAVQALAS